MRTLCTLLLSFLASACGSMGPVGGINGVMRSDPYDTEVGAGFSFGVREQGNNAQRNEFTDETFYDAFPRIDLFMEFYPRGEKDVVVIRDGRTYRYAGMSITASSDQKIEGSAFRTITGLRYTLLGRQSSSYASRIDIGVHTDWETVLVTNDLEWEVQKNQIFEIETPAFNDNQLRLGGLVGWNLRYKFVNFRLDAGPSLVVAVKKKYEKGEEKRKIGDVGGHVGLSLMLGY